MSDPIFAEKDAETILADALARYQAITGVALAPADPRRLHLQALLYHITQLRSLVDYAGKQNLLRYVSAAWIDALADLWAITPEAAKPSRCTLRWTASIASLFTIAAGKRATNGKYIWAVIGATDGTLGDVTTPMAATYLDVLAECTVAGAETNGAVAGQIDTIVDAIPGIASVVNTATTKGGKNAEGLEEFRARIREEPERSAVAGPRGAYEAIAKRASSAVADAVALAVDDAGEMAGTPPEPGEVHIVVLEGTVDDDGVLTAIPDNTSSDLLDTVEAAASADTVRPLGDYVIVKAPEAVEFDISATYYIARSRSRQAAEIQAAVEAAFDVYKLWQQSKIGRDINPDELRRLLTNAGAKRLAVAVPTFTALAADERARLVYETLTYGGIEND